MKTTRARGMAQFKGRLIPVFIGQIRKTGSTEARRVKERVARGDTG